MFVFVPRYIIIPNFISMQDALRRKETTTVISPIFIVRGRSQIRYRYRIPNITRVQLFTLIKRNGYQSDL